MTYEEILRELASLPPEGQKEVVDFIIFLRERYAPPPTDQADSDLANLGFVGIWRDREDMRDSSTWVRTVREREWVR